MLFLSIPYIGTERIVFLNCSQKNLKIFRKHSRRLHLYFADFYLPAKMMMFCLLLFLQQQHLNKKKKELPSVTALDFPSRSISPIPAPSPKKYTENMWFQCFQHMSNCGFVKWPQNLFSVLRLCGNHVSAAVHECGPADLIFAPTLAFTRIFRRTYF